MTKAEEQNLWKRLVALEEKVAGLLFQKTLPTRLPKEGGIGGIGDPPRDRYGVSVGRPDM